MEPVNFVVSKNLHRRHLSGGQKAVVALEILPWLEREAAQRQLRLAGSRPSQNLTQRIGGGDKPIAKPHSGESAAQAAKLTGTNRQYVSDAKRIQNAAPFANTQIESLWIRQAGL